MSFSYNPLYPASSNTDDILVLIGILLAFGVNATLVILAYVSAIKITSEASARDKRLVVEKPERQSEEPYRDNFVDGPGCAIDCVEPVSEDSPMYTDGYGNPIDKPEYLVTIVRGVPGSGKTQYVYYLESLEENNGSSRIFSICDAYDYFYVDNQYYYRADQMDRATQYCFSKFLNSIKDGVKRIYVVGDFPEPYMYQNYLDLAQEYGYNWKVDEMTCPDVDHLWLYNQRNKHGIPMKKSIKIYNRWEIDQEANLVEPYIPTDQKESWKGDCIPKYDCTVEDLDRELLDYLYGRESYQKYRRLSYNPNKMTIDIDRVSKKEKKALKIWEITKVAKNYEYLLNCSHDEFSEHYYNKWGEDYCDAIYESATNVLENVYTNIDTNTTYFHPYADNDYI